MDMRMTAPDFAPGIREGLSGLETKFAKFDGIVDADGTTRISGYASLFGEADQSGDIVQSGAYAKSLAALKADGGRVKMLWQHDPAQPIGIWDEVREDDRGLWVSGRLLDDVAKGREAARLIAAGAIEGLSIGYRTVRAQKTPEGNRLLLELDLWEVSLVTFPMLPSAKVAAKSQGHDPDWETLTAIFDDARAALAQLPASRKKD